MILKNQIVKIIKIGLIVVILTPIMSANASYETGKIAYDEYRYDEAYLDLKTEAENGHMLAQYYLAIMYAMGHSVPRNDISAYSWFMKAALQGHPISQGNIGTMKLNSRGTDYDLTGSYYWFILAENGGFEKARKFMWRVTNYMKREDIESSQIKADDWIKNNRE